MTCHFILPHDPRWTLIQLAFLASSSVKMASSSRKGATSYVRLGSLNKKALADWQGLFYDDS
jgi:hypothetical protein